MQVGRPRNIKIFEGKIAWLLQDLKSLKIDFIGLFL